MGSCSTVPEVAEDVIDLQFEQSYERFAANGGLIYSLSTGQQMPLRNICYGAKYIYFNDRGLAVLRENPYPMSQ